MSGAARNPVPFRLDDLTEDPEIPDVSELMEILDEIAQWSGPPREDDTPTEESDPRVCAVPRVASGE